MTSFPCAGVVVGAPVTAAVLGVWLVGGDSPNTVPATNRTARMAAMLIIRLVREYSTHRRIGGEDRVACGAGHQVKLSLGCVRTSGVSDGAYKRVFDRGGAEILAGADAAGGTFPGEVSLRVGVKTSSVRWQNPLRRPMSH